MTAGEKQPLLDNGDTMSDIRMALILCSLIYTLGTMRQIAKENDLQAVLEEGGGRQLLSGDLHAIAPQPSEIPAHPLNPEDLRNLIDRFPEFSEIINSDAGKFDKECIEALCNMFSGSSTTRGDQFQRAFINNFNAVHDTAELVYGITALTRHKDMGRNQVAVVFRGSVHTRDWLQNITMNMVEIRIQRHEITREGKKSRFKAWLVAGGSCKTIPIDYKLAEQLEDELRDGDKRMPILVHQGFLDYLFAEQQTNDKPKYDEIVKNLKNLASHVQFLDRSDLTVTGHSLGGALSTLLSFFLACDEGIGRKFQLSKDVEKYVSCVSFAAPLVGDAGFQKAFRLLETKGRLKHVRVTNDRDFVPLVPPLPSYRHTGVQVHLRRKKEPRLRNTRGTPYSAWWPFWNCMLWTFPIVFIPIYGLIRNILIVLFRVPWLFWVGVLYILLMDSVNSYGLLSGLRRFLREQILPMIGCVFFIYLILLLLKPLLPFDLPEIEDYEPAYFHELHLPENMIPLTDAASVVLDRLDAAVIPFLLCWQVIVLANKPQDVYQSRKEGDRELGITHSLPFYDYNFADTSEYNKGARELWIEGQSTTK